MFIINYLIPSKNVRRGIKCSIILPFSPQKALIINAFYFFASIFTPYLRSSEKVAVPSLFAVAYNSVTFQIILILFHLKPRMCVQRVVFLHEVYPIDTANFCPLKIYYMPVEHVLGYFYSERIENV